MDTLYTALYLENAALKDYAAAAARLLTPTETTSGQAAARRLRQDFREIRHCYDNALRRYGDLTSPPPQWEWLLDNWYMVQREMNFAFPVLLRAKTLRNCREGLLVEALCRSLVLAGQGRITEERLAIYLAGFEGITVLTQAELAVLPAALRAALLSGIAAMCRNVRRGGEEKQVRKCFEALFGSLRLLAVLDMETLLRCANKTDAILAGELQGDYGRMDSGTRAQYLRRVEKLARRAGLEEHEYARRLVQQAREQGCHVGFFLFPEKGKHRSSSYIAVNVLLSLLIPLLTAFWGGSFLLGLLLLLPVSELVKSAVDFLLLHLVPPRRLFRMDVQDGIPPEGRSLCVISTLLGEEANAGRLEELYHACKSEGEALLFGLLADLPGADHAKTPEDAAMVQDAAAIIDGLNRKYGHRFYLFTRERQFDGLSYTAKERKRGALLELAKLLCDRPSELKVFGERDALSGLRYIITLDSDTRIYPGSLGQLIGAMLHPLNRPVLDERHALVRRGHALIHPRIDTELQSAVETDFSLIFSGGGGSDPYGCLCGELYMDAFGSGGFAGKGILDAQALLRCTARFPEGRVLSHDAPEGACLRGAYMGDVSFSDRFPARPLSYYRRLHRWIRGDWQNLPFLFWPGLAPIERWRLLDSLRRSLIAPATLFAILVGFFAPAVAYVAAWAALLALLSHLFLAMAEELLRSRDAPQPRHYARLLNGVGGAIVQTFLRLWLLPYEAWISLSAIITALWRMLVSHKRLLQWQTAAQSLGEQGLAAHVRAMLLPVLLGLMLLFLCPAVIGKSAGLLWLLSPASAAALALNAGKEHSLSSEEKDYLHQVTADSYRYFESFHQSRYHYLPPDNFQEQPPVGVAKRSSPTNIGLSMLASTAALDLGLITKEKLTERIGDILNTLEAMPRAQGHYYNWYDIESLQPLQPAYISTVDAGNLYACLLCVERSLRELSCDALAQRLERLLQAMDFSLLYDKKRELFHICYDPEKKRGIGGWYDLMASEAMLTSYLACAKGDVPVRHWRRLGRAQLQKDGFRGLASWTGTMFEYLMPALFLPFARGSLLYESGRFCLYAQKKRVWAGKPWGISESAFYSLDSTLSYRYKAHGVAALALKRGQDNEMVISPYSSFLALAMDPNSAIKNLQRLESLGAMGRFGFIEALDFTAGRCRSDRGEQVRCYMAHHLGMSIAAAANALCQDRIRQRFLSDPAMNAFSMLLQERVEDGGVILRRDSSPIPERFSRSDGQQWLLRGGEEDRELHCSVLSNGAYTLYLSNRGHSRAFCGPIALYGCDERREESGEMRALLESETETLSLLPAENTELWELGEESSRIRVRGGTVTAELITSAAYGDCGERRQILVRPEAAGTLRLSLSFRPILAPSEEYRNHPAFWLLGLQAQTEGNTLLLRRLPRGRCRELWLCISCSVPVRYSADRAGGCGALSQPLVSAVAELSCHAGENRELSFALAYATSREEAISGAARILTAAAQERGNMVGAAALHLKMSREEIGAAMALFQQLWRERPREGCAKAVLWQYGVSGDRPLICCDGRAVEAEALLRRFCLLKSCNVEADLIYFSEELGEYRQPILSKIRDCLRQLGLEALLGAPGGVHILPMQAAEAVSSRAVFRVGERRPVLPAAPRPQPGAARGVSCVPEHQWTEQGFAFTVNNDLPARVWQLPLCNGSFGYLATDCGCGNLWLDNARELTIDLPCREAWGIRGSEWLWLVRGEERISLFAANDGYPCRVLFSPGCAVWEKTIGDRCIRTTAFVPRTTRARVLLIEGAVGMKLGWTLEPTLAGNADALRISAEGRTLFAQNPDAYLDGTVFTAMCSRVCTSQWEFSPPAMHFSVISDESTIFACGVCPTEELEQLCVVQYAREALADVKDQWLRYRQALHLSSGDTPLDHYLNHWAVYQILACRLWARCSIYQSGGAFGFRDQLQDSINLLLLTREPARQRILDACRHQYREGDVMHWWHPHPQGDKGVRTRCSDDLLWLVWALCEYTEKTGDLSFCWQEEAFVLSQPLDTQEQDRYETPQISTERVSVLQHARLALDYALARGLGLHGLPLMGSGDWNDAMDLVNGESVWLGWFLIHCCERFALLLEKLGEAGAEAYTAKAAALRQAAESAWCGRWYCRGYFPDGQILGGSDRLDSIAQSWAVLCGESDSKRPQVAVDSALHLLVDRQHRLVRLFDPPYSAQERPVGYISGYGEGFRENGGQYTHGAVWLAMACLRLGRVEEGWEILSLLLPENHKQEQYAAEPFVLPADVYAATGHEGEAGWTWYTGSAGWYFRTVYEELLGLQLRDGKLLLRPRLPAALPCCTVYWTDAKRQQHQIQLSHKEILVDGKPYRGEAIG